MSFGGHLTLEFHPPGSDDLAFWADLAATFRDKFGDMSSSPSDVERSGVHAIDQQVMDTKAPKSDINNLVLDYLTMEGYTLAAAKFSKEANLSPRQEDPAIKARQEIRNSIHQGKIQEAIEALNRLDPEILDTDARLHFALLRLQLVELIRNCDGDNVSTIAAIKFASEQLGPRVPRNDDFLIDLEKTMALFLYPRNDLRPEQQALLHPDLRMEVADKVNKAIVWRQTKRREAAIRQLIKVRTWAEGTVRTAGKDLPEHLDFGLTGEAARISRDAGGAEPMETS